MSKEIEGLIEMVASVKKIIETEVKIGDEIKKERDKEGTNT